jgi:acyl-coenzyme A synthetase/AMP-(fatty) acid ligase
MHILDMIFYWAKTKPNHLAVIQSDAILTFATLAERVDSVARKITELNLDPDEPVAVLIEHRTRQLIVCFALLHLGYTIAPAYAGLLPHLQASGIDTVIHDRKAGAPRASKNIYFDDSWFRPVAPQRESKPRRREIGDLIFFTSGSTGVPKKTTYTVGAFFERLYRSNPLIEGNYPRTLIVPGIDVHYGFFPSWAILSAGHTICFAPTVELSLMLLSSHRVNYIITSPQQALELVTAAEKNAGYQLDSVQAFRIGGGVVTKDLIGRVQASFCPNVVITYGATETGTMAFATYDRIASVPGAVGIVAPWAEVEIVDEAGNILGPGVQGRVRARTPTFMELFAAENSGADTESAKAWWYPGDIGRLTEDGILCIAGRVDDVLNRGGVSVSAVELEETLRSRAGIADAGVCGVIGEAGILQIWAGVVPQPDFDFKAFMRSLQADEAVRRKIEANIDRVVVIDRIPRTQVGKIQRGELREMLIKLKSAPQS